MRSGQVGTDGILVHEQYPVPSFHCHAPQYLHPSQQLLPNPYHRYNFLEPYSFQSLKRPRASEDDDESSHCPPTKKRKLRHRLTTSHLSKPSAEPASYVPTRPPWRRGIWARHRTIFKDLLRRAAIFNSIASKRRPSGMRGINACFLTKQASRMEEWSQTSCPHSTDESGREHERSDIESDAPDEEDYDAFDESETPDSSDDEADEVEGIVYSDFNLLRSDELDADLDMQDEGFSFDSFDNGQTFTGEDGAKAMALLLEIERSSEASFAPSIGRKENRVIGHLGGV